MPVTEELKIRLLLKEAFHRVEIAAEIAANDFHSAARLAEISHALDELAAYLSVEERSKWRAKRRPDQDVVRN
jgi:hypothetical protein